jgi:predicted TIM-barrel fold metal-dependent hydrolase
VSIVHRGAGTDVDTEIFGPGLPIIDTHHHLWNIGEWFFSMPGTDGIRRYSRYLFDEFLADLDTGHDVRATVYMEADPMRPMYRIDGPPALRPLGEVEFATGVAAMAASGAFGPTRVAAAIVAHTRLEEHEATVRQALDAYRRVADERFRGIRQPTISSAIPGLYRDPRFRRGFALLEEYGLTFDALVGGQELADVADLAGAFPGTTIVLDHAGSPAGIDHDAWLAGIRAVAAHPNVVIKLGGLGMEGLGDGLAGSEQLAVVWRPYLQACIEAFGTDRCMFESNFPMDSEVCGYRTLWNAFARLTAGASLSEQRDLFALTASRVYRIEI